MFSNSLIDFFYVYQYQFIDDLNYIFPPNAYYNDVNLMEKQIAIVKEFFVENGWEGDGEIGLIWIPPFLDESFDNSSGLLVWHVKQDNNGISFIASEKEILSSRFLNDIVPKEISDTILVKDNNTIYDDDNLIKVTITEDLKYILVDQLENLHKQLKEAYALKQNKTLSNELYDSILVFIQNDMISDFNVFIDECYLKFLIHIFNCKNVDNLKLKPIKSTIKLNDIALNSQYDVPELIIQQIISNCWNDFKFLPFNDKFNTIIKCVDYPCDNDIKREIFKHVTIRNCYQHHEGQLTEESLKKLGKEKISLKDDNNSIIELGKWECISLYLNELESLIETMSSFVNNYNSYIGERMTAREGKKDYSNPINELSKYIYYLLYGERCDEVELTTPNAVFSVWEGHPLKVNGEDSTMKELYELIDETGEKVECNKILFTKKGDKYLTEKNIYPKAEKPTSSIIQF